MKTYKRITIVEKNDTLIGYEKYPKAIAKGLIRRVSCVFVFDTEGKILIQKRSANVRCPHLFDCSAGGHVDEGESYKDAALREMQEELGITAPLQEVVVSYRTAESFNAVYKALVPYNTSIEFNDEEISSVAWVTLKEIDSMVLQQQPVCVDSFIQIWNDLRATLIA
jgi:isopentenyl-diphosphate delta-isomerase